MEKESTLIVVVFGTRPEIIKLSPIIRLLVSKQMPITIIHTGQHYNFELDRIFLDLLEIPKAKYQLEVGSGSHGVQLARIIHGVEAALLNENPDTVLVQGDTNSVMATALVCAKIKDVTLGHVEAGLRSYDRTMPEEVNRVVTDHLSDLLFAPTLKAKENLIGEGIGEEKILVTGNTIVDAVVQNIRLAEQDVTILSDLSVGPGSFILLTIHRQENVTDARRLYLLAEAINRISDYLGLPVVCPLHPRTRKAINNCQIGFNNRVLVIEPVGYLEFLMLEQKARLILTDSGGVQEEACILGTPCVTLRENTERPETCDVGANCLGGYRYDSIRRSVDVMLARETNWANPLGDGRASERIVESLCQYRKSE